MSSYPKSRASSHISTTTAPATSRPQEISETFEDYQKREQAAFVLSRTDHLIWHANARNESLPQTRLHFLKLLTGLSPTYPPARYTEASHGELAPSQRTSSTPDKTKRKAKDRISGGASNENRRVSGTGPSENRRVSGTGSVTSPKANISPRSLSKTSEEAKADRRAARERARRANPLERMDGL